MTSLSRAALDALYEPLGANIASSKTGLRIGNVELNTIYAALSNGSANGTTTGLQMGGTDLKGIFAGLGTVQVLPNIILNGGSTSASGFAAGGFLSISVTFTSTGDITATNADSFTGVSAYLDSIANGNGADFEMKWVKSSGSGVVLTPAGTTSGVYASLSSNRAFTAQSENSISVGNFVVTIRPINLSAPAETLSLVVQSETL